ncbi:hypothetical protein DV735_g4695, partial [Chaetothyriales sp. CBS 134920]
METAPLTLAHNHARNAAHETKQNNAIAASEEHELAATEFATAASGSGDYEAIRILRLLERHHQSLADIIRLRHEKPNSHPSDEKPVTTSPLKHEAAKSASVSEAQHLLVPGSNSRQGTVPLSRPPHPASAGTRELSSSIASNLASARGIPTHRHKPLTPVLPLLSSQHADGQIPHQDGQPGLSAPSRPSWAPPLTSSSPAAGTEAEGGTDDSNAPFQLFYKQVESMISKLGAPLAFAGLNLASAKVPEPESTAANAQSDPRSLRQSETDYSQLISRAALRAVNDPRAHSINESFFFVPTSGGTMTYAESLGRRGRTHTRIPSTLSNISEDDFIDARTSLSPPGAKQGVVKNEPMVDGQTMEELALRNQTLQQQLDLVTRRLHAFEMSSQSSTAALAQSIRLMPKSPLASPAASRTHHAHGNQASTTQVSTATANDETEKPSKQAANEALNQRITELEELLRRNDAKTRKKDEENAKLRDTLLRYREKWENLKQGARARREGQQQQQRVRGDKSAGGGDVG